VATTEKPNAVRQEQQKSSAMVSCEKLPVVRRCNSDLSQYIRSKGFPLQGDEAFFAARGFQLAVACRAANKLAPEYDVGIGLAWGGAPISFIFEKHGLPVKLVAAKRKGAGVIWRPIDELNYELLRGRKVLVLEIDVLAGRTLRRAMNELEQYKPSKIDLLLERSHTFIPISYYKKLIKKGGIWGCLPPLDQSLAETARVIQRRYAFVKRVILGKEKIMVEYENGAKVHGEVLLADLKANVPKGFGKIMTLDDHFTFYLNPKSVRAPLDAVEEKILSGDMKQYGTPERVGILMRHYLDSFDVKLRK
jgi:hypothetical protein